MSRPVKVILYIVAAALVGALVTGVAFWTANSAPEDPAPGLYVNGEQVAQPGDMLTVGDYAFDFDVYRHYFLLNKSMFESLYGENMWETDPDGDLAWALRKSVETELVALAAWMEVAKEEGIELTEEDHQEIADTIAEQKETHGEDFDTYLEDMFLPDEATYLRITEMQKLSEKTQTAYADKQRARVEDAVGEEADTLYEEEYITAKHILINADTGAEDAEQAKEDALDRAEAILKEIWAEAEAQSALDADSDDATNDDSNADDDAGTTDDDADAQDEDAALAPVEITAEAIAAAFDAAMHEYSEDPGLETNPDGYTFKEGDMVTVFYDTALALAEYDVSEPVWSESSNYSGWHILLRLPLDTSGMAEHRETAVTTEVNRLKQEKLDEMKKAMPLVKNQYIDGITPQSIY